MDIDWNTLPTFMRGGTLFQCGNCGDRGLDPAKKLKRCNACQTIMYCSKECQKAAWPIHKDTCNSVRDWRRGNEPKKFGGYDTPAQLANALGEWVRRQRQSLHFLARATILTCCNVEETFASPHVLLIMVHPGPSPGAPGWNPGNAFHLISRHILKKDELRSMAPGMTDQHWDTWMAECQAKADQFRSAPRIPNAQLPFLGTMPTLFITTVCSITVLHSFDIQGLRFGDRVSTPMNDIKSRPYFDDLVSMCVGAVNKGYVFRQPTQQVSYYSPDVGVYVQKGRKWKWQILQNFNWTLFTRCRIVVVGTGVVAGIDPQVTWGMYYNL
ncbi:hypothetical protein FKP32DRAFT_1598797 [Trametes sanguinea]|nr:hypothetical protein FKP32DRAFT_1598797 [Trametes sanguinea]